ncbi:MAG: sodium:solute symporter family protein [Rubripirellula sp.]|jgi:Na+/proline symporter|nr:sodium:solute symporter family protein [Rubripirellula sp.]
MNDPSQPLGWAEVVVIGAYLMFLLLIGLAGWRSRRANTLADFYLGGNGTGLFVLILTLYATQYSGNTLFGFTGKTYRVGLSWTVSVQFMTAIVVAYLCFAPRLFALSRKFSFITPGDFLEHRFRYKPLTFAASGVMIVAIANFLLAQMMAMGKAVEGLFPQHAITAYCSGVIFLAAIMLVYETLGGFRAVAWTDAIQGGILMFGFVSVLYLIFSRFGSLELAMQRLEVHSPETLQPPTWKGIAEWVSYLVIVGLGCSLYPQAIQRIYCARNSRTLRLSLAVMAFLPLITTTVSLLAGMMGRAYFPELPSDQSDSLLTILCREVQQDSLLGRWLVVVLFAAILAAIMSTADSVVLSISSMLTKDWYASSRPFATEGQMLRFGNYCSWLCVAGGVTGAILLRETTLVTMLDRKLDLLVQLTPAFMLGLWWKGLDGKSVFLGLLVGLTVSLSLVVLGYSKLLGIHAGLYGLICNLLLVWGRCNFWGPSLDRSASVEACIPGDAHLGSVNIGDDSIGHDNV